MKSIYKKLILKGLTPAAALAGAYLIVPWEGGVDAETNTSTPYEDVVGVMTVCYGHTGSDIEKRFYTLDECIDLLALDTQEAEDYVDHVIKEPFISDYEKAAYIDFTYNLGVGNLKVSTMAKLINSGKHEEACSELVRWVYAGGKKLNGLLYRRNVETDFCLGNITVEEYETHIREITEQVNQKLEEGVSNLQCMVPPSQLDYSCQYGGVFCPSSCSEYDLNKTYISISSHFSDPWYSWSYD